MSLDIQQLVNGLALGSLYGGLALAIVLIFRATDILNFAQGELATLCTYIAWTIIVANHVPYWIGFIAALVLAFGVGALVERTVVRPVEGAQILTAVIVTFGVFLIANSVDLGVWGGIPVSFPGPFGEEAIEVGGIYIGRQYLGILVSSLLIMAGVFLYFRFTKTGLAMRAATSNPAAARLMGISVERMRMLGWGLSCTVGAAAGIFLANLTLLEPNMTAGVLIYAFAAVVLGGITSPLGAVVAGLSLGVLETLAGTTDLIGSELKTPFAFFVFVIVIVIRPGGLFKSAGGETRV